MELRSQQHGFTLIEVLMTVVILSILSALSMGAMYVYKQDAEYSKAENLIKTAQTAIVLGSMEAPDGVHGYFESGDAGGMVPANMADFLPGAVTPKDVKLGALLETCPADLPLVNMFLVARPCKADREVSWIQFCDGTQVYNENVAHGGC